MPFEVDPRIKAEVDRLRSMRIKELRALWRAKFKTDPPTAFGPDLLRRSLAYKIQEDTYGGLDAATRRTLNQLVAQYMKAPTSKVVQPRQMKPGAILVRVWKGERHQVTIMEAGFAYQGKKHESLSEIARLITGTRWNGPRFFGLRAGKDGI